MIGKDIDGGDLAKFKAKGLDNLDKKAKADKVFSQGATGPRYFIISHSLTIG